MTLNNGKESDGVDGCDGFGPDGFAQKYKGPYNAIIVSGNTCNEQFRSCLCSSLRAFHNIFNFVKLF